MKAVSNSSPLIYLAKINSLDLLHEMFNQIYVPPAVYEETVTLGLQNNHSDAILIAKALEEGWIIVRNPDEKHKLKSTSSFHYGEVEAIQLALTFQKKYPLLLDEIEARTYAKILGIKVKGTLGILIANRENGKLNSHQAIEKLNELNKIMFLSSDLYSYVLEHLK